MKFLTKLAMVSLILANFGAAVAADAPARQAGSISGAIMSANASRMIAMPIAPGVNTNVNMVVPSAPLAQAQQINYCNAPYFDYAKCCAQPNPPANICNTPPIDFCKPPYFDYAKCCAQPNPPANICNQNIDYCKPPYFDYAKCCAQPNPPANICNQNIDYCKKPNFDYKKCCAQPNPPANICNQDIDYCKQPNFNKDKCCAQPNPPANICNEIDFCKPPYFDKDKCCYGPNPDPKICKDNIDYCKKPFFNKEKCCAQPNPPTDICITTDCGDIIPALGVDKCVAERACTGLWADGHQGVFDEATNQCLVPVVAHNWNGIIRVNGQDVMAYAPMGNVFKCGAESFEQVTYMRRSSQWVIPVMIVGGAGIGAGIGAIIDHYDNKKAENFKNEVAANAYNGHDASRKGNPYFTVTGGTATATLTWNGVPYNLGDPDSRKALAGKLGVALQPGASTDDKQLKDLIAATEGNINVCVADMFKELVSPKVRGQGKFGRIKITGDDACDSGGLDAVKYCQKDDKCVDCQGFNDQIRCPDGVTAQGKTFGTLDGNGIAVGGRCYFRDGLGPVADNPNADSTASDDVWRANRIQYFIRELPNLSNVQAIQKGGCTPPQVQNYSKPLRGQSRLRWVTFRCSTPFDVIANSFETTGTCDTFKLENTRDELMAAYGAASALKAYLASNPGAAVNAIDTTALEKLLATIETKVKAVTVSTTEEFDMRVDEEFGSKRPFFQTATGRGLLIGTGVGALGGLGYWFAEGASIWCNVGSLQQVKLGKSWSIPTFRDYIISHNYIQQ